MEFNSFPLFYKENLRTRPQDFIVNDATVAQVEQTAKKMRAERDAANPPQPEPARIEYNRLRQRLYDLQQRAKDAEVFCNNKADSVKGFEERINVVLLKKRQAIADGHLGQERACEHQLKQLETELVDAQKEFTQAKHWNAQAVRALKAFDSHARIAELKKQIDGGLLEAKSDNVPK
jgi:hypothetical protein